MWVCGVDNDNVFISNLLFIHFLVGTRRVSAATGPSSVVPQALIYYSCKRYTN
jgi:hypothetical protein